jgi:hypothetical protein
MSNGYRQFRAFVPDPTLLAGSMTSGDRDAGREVDSPEGNR